MARVLVGTVVSKKSDKTAVIVVRTRRTHPVYKKQYTVTKRFSVHDESNQAQEGDLVEAHECRPVSATKHFKLEKIIERAGVVHTGEADTAEVIEEIAPAKHEKAEEEA